MPSRRLRNFKGIVPRTDGRLLVPESASIAQDVKLWHGTIAPWRAPVVRHTADDDVMAMHLTDACGWVTSCDPDTKYAAGLPGCARMYKTSGCNPPMTASDTNAVADVWQRLGVPRPTAPPLVTPIAPSATAVETQDRAYVVVFANNFCELGSTSPPSPALPVKDGQSVLITNIPQPPAGWGVTEIVIYRTMRDFMEEQGEHTLNLWELLQNPQAWPDISFMEVARVPVGTTSYTDTVLDADLGELLISREWYPPPEGLQGLVATESGVLAGFVGNDVYVSERNTLHAFPIRHKLTLEDTPRAMIAQKNMIFVATDGHPYVIVDDEGCNEGRCRTVHRCTIPAPICGVRSLVTYGSAALFATDDGMFQLQADGTGRVVTEGLFAPDDWKRLLPGNMRAARYDRGVFLVTSVAGLVLDFRDGQPELTSISLKPCSLYESRRGRLYMGFGAQVHEWDAGDTYMVYRWKSVTEQLGGLYNLAAGRVVFRKCGEHFERPAVNIRVWGGGRQFFARDVRSQRPYRIPPAYHTDLAMDITGTEEVSELHYGPSIADLSSGT